MEINKDHMEGSPKGKPLIGKIVFRITGDTETQMAELLAGGVDWIWGISTDKAQDLKSMNAVDVLNAMTMRINYIAMDRADRAKGSSLKNKKVRLAIAYAIDHATISRELVGGSSIVIHSACFPNQFCCTQDVLKYRYVPVLE
jgi:peptide/nickel transport system substrate-binding protein